MIAAPLEPDFHNGYGMMTMQGTRKPSWRAFEALHGAGTRRLPVTGVPVADGPATRVLMPTEARAAVPVATMLGWLTPKRDRSVCPCADCTATMKSPRRKP